MPVTQIMSVAGRTGGGGGGPPPVTGDFFWSPDNELWIAFGSFYAATTYSGTQPTKTAYTYPDGSYSGYVREFTGSQWASSPNLGIGGAWQSNTISINYWFYPTANGVQLISESNVPEALNSYHYSVLEITSSGYVKACYYNGTYPFNSLTSTNQVQLNKWNHIYFAEDSQGGHIFELNGIGTTGLPTYVRAGPGSTSEYFIIGDSDATHMGNTGRFQGKIGYLSINDYVAGSTYNNNWARFNANNTGLVLGSSWTIEIIAELTPSTFWASLWGNESFDNSTGFVAYLNGSVSLNVGSPTGQDAYNVTGIDQKGYWAFTHESGQGIKMYRNGVLVNPNTPGFAQPAGGAGSVPLVIGSRHTNAGTGFTDPCPGVYYYNNVNTTTALDATAIQASYDALKTTYGLP